MDNLDSRTLSQDIRMHAGHTVMVDRKTLEAYRLVDVLITGGAPWGFTLKGGREHGELLIITKVEDGSKAADILMAGDEIVNINDQPLSGYRQEAIALVKGSYKTLKMIVKRRRKLVVNIIRQTMPSHNDVLVARNFLMKILRSSMRRNDIACRPHSWHSAKFLENPMETPQLSNSSVGSSWNSKYHSSSSSHDLTNPWEQTNLQRTSEHFSSMGSMDSIDQTYSGRLSSAKSNNSIDHLGSKRDSAYGSFSTSFMNPDHILSKSGSTSTENILYKVEQGYGKAGQILHEYKAHEDKPVYQTPPNVYESNKTQRTDEITDGRHSSRSNFGPVWYVPDTKKTSSPPPPLPPLRSDSYAATKSHEKPSGLAHLDITPSTQHFTVANMPHQRADLNPEIPDYQQRLVKITDRTLADMRRISNSSHHTDNLSQGASSYNDSYNNAPSHASRLQSLSTNDVRYAQPTYNYHHQRQYSDESTFYQNTKASVSHKPQQQQISYYPGVRELVDESSLMYTPHQARASGSSLDKIGGRQKVDNSSQSRINNVNTKQPPQGTTAHHYKEDYGKLQTCSDRPSVHHENVAINNQGTGDFLPQQICEPSLDNCETFSLKVTEKSDGHFSNKKNTDYFEDQSNNYNFAHHGYTDKNVLNSKHRSHQQKCSWAEEGEKITPQVTPMLHSLAQEGRNRSDSFPESGKEKQPFLDAGKQSRRSDRFATTLRNEIQQRRARLQKSKSTATLTDCSEMENLEHWSQDSVESMNPSSDGSFSSMYKNHLKEAQARVLRATSFQRRDLEPGLADHPSVSPERRIHSSNMSVYSPDTSPSSADRIPPKQNSSQNISRIGGRKRFTAQQKLRSYSEPEKMNEVGIYEDEHYYHSHSVTQEAVGSFADRWKFFEETSKSSQPKQTPKPIPPHQADVRNFVHHIKESDKEPPEPWQDKRARAVSLGPVNLYEQKKDPNKRFQDVSSRSIDNISSEQPQRLGTFAEYQASWKEQKKPLERKNSGRCHSADNILDAGLEQSQKTQYIHERSRSSPTTDFYAQGAIVDSKKQPAGTARESSETASLTQCSSSSSSREGSSLRITEVEDPSRLKDNSLYNKWKPPGKAPQITETVNAPQESRARSGTLPSDYRFVNENVKQGNRDIGYSSVPIPEAENVLHVGEENQWQDQTFVNKKRGPPPQRPPPPKLDSKYWSQNGSTSSLTTSSESLLTAQGKSTPSFSPNTFDSIKFQSTHVPPDKNLNVSSLDPLFSEPSQNEQSLEKKHIDHQTTVSSKSSYLQKPGMEPSRSPSPQFAPQKLTDKPPLLAEEENVSRIERVIDNTTVKMVPIKIVHSESNAEKESRHNLLSAVEPPPALPTGLAKDQLKTLSTSEQSYSRFCAYTRHEPDPEVLFSMTDKQLSQDPVGNANENKDSQLPSSSLRSKDIYADLKSEELMREIVGKDKSLADILDPNTKMRTTMDLMEGIFQKDEHLLEEAQQRRKLHPKVPSPRPPDEKKEEQNATAAISLTTSSAYYSTSAPKAELLIKMKDMQEQQHTEESSEDELDNNLSEKKQELIDSISRKLQVLREAKETLLEDIQCNNALGEEVEVIVKEVCKPNEFDKFRMFIGDLEKIVNLLLSLSGRLARVENALNNLDETASPEERRTLVEKRKLLTRQHEDAKELKENLDRRERTVFDILANYLNEENLADYEHFVKMKSALILEQRELEDKIKLGEEQLKCLTDSLPLERVK